MSLYRKYSARVALVALVASILAGLALVPARCLDTVWPLSRHFGHHHLIAVVELLFAWGGIGIAIIGVLGVTIGRLLKQAEWIS